MGKRRVCAIYGCTPATNSDLKYHSFPKQEDIAKIWIHKCHRKDQVNPKTAVICDLHFSQDQKTRNLKYELLGCAVPSNFRGLKRLNQQLFLIKSYPAPTTTVFHIVGSRVARYVSRKSSHSTDASD